MKDSLVPRLPECFSFLENHFKVDRVGGARFVLAGKLQFLERWNSGTCCYTHRLYFSIFKTSNCVCNDHVAPLSVIPGRREAVPFNILDSTI